MYGGSTNDYQFVYGPHGSRSDFEFANLEIVNGFCCDNQITFNPQQKEMSCVKVCVQCVFKHRYITLPLGSKEVDKGYQTPEHLTNAKPRFCSG